MKKRQNCKIKLPFSKLLNLEYVYKTLISSAFSVGCTILFALYNGYLGIRLFSAWHISAFVFYLFLILIRGCILWTEKQNRNRSESEQQFCRRRTFLKTAVLLLLLNLALILPISLMVVLKRPVHMKLIPAIAMAAYTTYKITVASVHIRKRKRTGNLLVAELRTVNFIDALVSVLLLQNTLIMVNQPAQNESSMLVLTAISSAVIYIVIVIVSVHMLIKGIKQK